MSKVILAATIATLTARIAADTAKLATAETQLEQFDLLDAVTVGSQIEFKIGRDTTRRAVVGQVRAVKVEEDGSKKFKVEYSLNTEDGSYDADGFENTFGVVATAAITRVHADEHGNLC